MFKSFFSAATLSLILATLCHADLTITQTLEEYHNNKPFRKQQVTLFVSGQRIRFDQGQNISSIILADKKLTFSIMHKERQYVVLPHEQVKPNESKSTASEDSDLPPSAVQSTGRTQEINGFQCRECRITEKDGLVTEMWISDKALDMNVFLKEFQSFLEFGLAPASKQLEKFPQLKGIPIRVTELSGTTILRQATVDRLDTTKIEDKFFEVPAGYEELKISDPTPPPSLPKK
jgi:hypothetical protein